MSDKPTLDLWNRVSKTDPKHVKPITGKQYSGNSPKPYYIVQRLTEEFGPCGLGWGFTIMSERMEHMSPTDVLHVAHVRLWYVQGEKRGEFDQMGQTKAAYMTAAGKLLVDEDAPKKSVTDALVKCASYLGFAGDIFSGRWDDSKYVADLKKEFSPNHPDGKGDLPEPRTDSLVPALKASIAANEAKGIVAKPNFPKVADLVLADNEELSAETKDYLNELAASIAENFPKSGPVKAVDRIDSEGLSSTQYIYMADKLPSPMRNAIKKASAARHQPETTT